MIRFSLLFVTMLALFVGISIPRTAVHAYSNTNQQRLVYQNHFHTNDSGCYNDHSVATCDGQDPYETGCWADAKMATQVALYIGQPPYGAEYDTIGATLWYSPHCQTNWAEVSNYTVDNNYIPVCTNVQYLEGVVYRFATPSLGSYYYYHDANNVCDLYTLMVWAPNSPAEACVYAITYQGWKGNICTDAV